MHTFRQLFREKIDNEGFKALYDRECNVCAYTVRIFERIEILGIGLERLAGDMKVSEVELNDLKEADCCNPRLVIDLCRHLALEAPQSCPKLG